MAVKSQHKSGTTRREDKFNDNGGEHIESELWNS